MKIVKLIIVLFLLVACCIAVPIESQGSESTTDQAKNGMPVMNYPPIETPTFKIKNGHNFFADQENIWQDYNKQPHSSFENIVGSSYYRDVCHIIAIGMPTNSDIIRKQGISDIEITRLICKAPAEAGDLAAQRIMAFASKATNASEALYWFEKAGAQGDVESQVQAFEMLYSGQGVKKNQKRALSLLKKLADRQNEIRAEQGDVDDAQRDDGVLIPQDFEKALYWFTRASEQGNDESHEQAADMVSDDRGVELEPNQE